MKNLFLDSDHKISLDASVKVINQEIQWCYQHPMANRVDPNFRDGFIKGLEQAKGLLIEMAEVEAHR